MGNTLRLPGLNRQACHDSPLLNPQLLGGVRSFHFCQRNIITAVRLRRGLHANSNRQFWPHSATSSTEAMSSWLNSPTWFAGDCGVLRWNWSAENSDSVPAKPSLMRAVDSVPCRCTWRGTKECMFSPKICRRNSFCKRGNAEHEGLAGQVRFVAQDWRAIGEPRDGSFSVRMLEHVAAANYRQFG